MEIPLSSILRSFSKETCHAEHFLGLDTSASEQLKCNIKNMYDFTKRSETKHKSKGNALKGLIVEGFDTEQIWQQIELQNEDVLESSIRDLTNILSNKDKLIFKNLNNSLINGNNNVSITDEGSDSESEDSQHEIDKSSDKHFESRSDNSDEESSDEDEYNDPENTATSRNSKKCAQKHSIVDDEFFKLDEMERFLENEENPKKTNTEGTDSDSDEEGSVNLFDEDSNDSSEEEKNGAKTARFKDYFAAKDSQPKKKVNKLLQELEANDSESEPEDKEELEKQLKSTLELRQERLKKKIEDLEEQAISEKPWQLKGEITAESRPQNSLLEEVVEFDLTSRPAPVITEQTSLQLEDIIKRRIKDKVFDSVEKKVKPTETPLEYKKKLVLDQEKSKESLANIYEREYLEHKAALEKDKMDMDEEEPELHKEVKKLMKNLFSKLDALSNFHFTSTPAIPELKIVSNLPAVNMEEVAPVAASDAALLAPEEIRNKPRGEVMGKSEKTKTDKKRERRKKKLKQKIHSKLKGKKEKKISKKLKILHNNI